MVGAREEPIDNALIRSGLPPNQAVLSLIDPLHLENLPRLDPVQPAQLRWKDDLSFAGYPGPHKCKIPSYMSWVNISM